MEPTKLHASPLHNSVIKTNKTVDCRVHVHRVRLKDADNADNADEGN